jgi:putative transposase
MPIKSAKRHNSKATIVTDGAIIRRNSVAARQFCCRYIRPPAGALVFQAGTAMPASDLAVGIDVGVATFATFSDGTKIQNPRIYQNAQAELRRAQRKVSRRKKGSNRRRKAVVQLQQIHARIVSQRSDFLDQHSTSLVRKYETIAVEALNVAGMSRSSLAKQILDCSWSEFFRMLKYKAAEAGRRIEETDPRYTSQQCS